MEDKWGRGGGKGGSGVSASKVSDHRLQAKGVLIQSTIKGVLVQARKMKAESKL
jgi:hypothetical protein